METLNARRVSVDWIIDLAKDVESPVISFTPASEAGGLRRDEMLFPLFKGSVCIESERFTLLALKEFTYCTAVEGECKYNRRAANVFTYIHPTGFWLPSYTPPEHGSL